MTGHYFQSKTNFFENEKGLTLVELIVLMIFLALLSTLAIPRFIDLELCTEQEAIEKGVGSVRATFDYPIKKRKMKPEDLPLIAEKIAELKKTSFDQVAKKTTENAKKVFNLP